MAIMCPDKPRECNPGSDEERLFGVLEKGLSNDYYVFHSVSILDVDYGMTEHEIDFVVFHPHKGILVIEAKNSRIRYENAQWVFGNGESMPHNGPFRQASTNMNFLLKKLQKETDGENHIGYKITDNCKFHYAVWLPLYSRSDIEKQKFPQEADIRIIITKDSEECIQDEISRIMDLPVMIGEKEKRTSLKKEHTDFLLESFLAPTFKVISIAETKKNGLNRIYKSMQDEQVRLLDYLEEQPLAVINGRAGTGKTVMALEKAKRHAAQGDNVLFLAYNSMLVERLREQNFNSQIDFYNIDSLAQKLLNQFIEELDIRYGKLLDKLSEMIDNDSIKWKHIVVDEGQDFSHDGLELILDLLQDYVVHKEDEGYTFYVFYDRNQFVQGYEMPACIQEADCRLTLYKNCRNTNQIADTSEQLLRCGLGEEKYREGKKNANALDDRKPEMFIFQDASEAERIVNQLLDEYIRDGYEDIQILTCCSPEKNSILSSKWEVRKRKQQEDYKYKYGGKQYPVTTARKFKGLEADAVIVTDMGMSMLQQKNKVGLRWDDSLLPYVAATRARFRLGILAGFSRDDCVALMEKFGRKIPGDPVKNLLVKGFHAIYGKSKSSAV